MGRGLPLSVSARAVTAVATCAAGGKGSDGGVDPSASGEHGLGQGDDDTARPADHVLSDTSGEVTRGVDAAARNRELEAENATLRARVDQLEPRVEQLERENRLLREAPDLLTGLMTRKTWEAEAPGMLQTAAHPALIFADANNLKQVNDSFGHSAGDRFLQSFGDRLRRHFGDGVESRALIARLSGDEFSILIDEADNDRLEEAARRCVVDINGTVCGGSFGLARPEDVASRELYPGQDLKEATRRVRERLDRLQSAADQAMYRAKALCHTGHITALEVYGPDDQLVPSEPGRSPEQQGHRIDVGFTYEETLLGSLMYRPTGFDLLNVSKLKSDDFSSAWFADVYNTLHSLYRGGQLTDVTLLPSKERVAATRENQQRVSAALQTRWGNQATGRQTASLLFRLTKAAPPAAAPHQGVFAPPAQALHARKVLEESVLRTCATINAEMRQVPVPTKRRFLSFLPSETTRTVQRWATQRRETIDRAAQRLADGLVSDTESPDTNDLSGWAARRGPVLTRGQDPAALPQQHGMLGAETHLIHVALHSTHAEAASLLSLPPDTFSTVEHAATWQIMRQLHEAEQPINHLSVWEAGQEVEQAGQAMQPPTPILAERDLYELGLAPPNRDPDMLARSWWVMQRARMAGNVDSLLRNEAIPATDVVTRAERYLADIESAAADPTSPLRAPWIGAQHSAGRSGEAAGASVARADREAPRGRTGAVSARGDVSELPAPEERTASAGSSVPPSTDLWSRAEFNAAERELSDPVDGIGTVNPMGPEMNVEPPGEIPPP